jgi:flagellar motor switch/type III secretory pathway protein FliN
MRAQAASFHQPSPISWPRIPVASAAGGTERNPDATAAGPDTLELLFGVPLRAFCDQAGADLSQALGFQLALAEQAPADAENTPDSANMVLMGILERGRERVRVELDTALAAPLVERTFGGPEGPATAHAEGRTCVPGSMSASLRAIQTLVTVTIAEALRRSGAGVVQPRPADPTARLPATPDWLGQSGEPRSFALALRARSLTGLLRIVHLPPPAEPVAANADPASEAAAQVRADGASARTDRDRDRDRDRGTGRNRAAPMPERWAERAHALALGIELGVSLQLSELRMPLTRLCALRPGDIIPIDRPRTLSLMSGGKAIARLPAGTLQAQPGPGEHRP